jgi:hypothetical protein
MRSEASLLQRGGREFRALRERSASVRGGYWRFLP